MIVPVWLDYCNTLISSISKNYRGYDLGDMQSISLFIEHY